MLAPALASFVILMGPPCPNTKFLMVSLTLFAHPPALMQQDRFLDPLLPHHLWAMVTCTGHEGSITTISALRQPHMRTGTSPSLLVGSPQSLGISKYPPHAESEIVTLLPLDL